MGEESLFSPTLISPSIRENFPQGYTIRPLERSDYHKGFFDCLATLTWVADVSEERFNAQFDWFKTRGQDWYYCVVIEHEGKIAGTGVVVVERKFIHNLGTIGHIEDISISKDHQGKQLGLHLLRTLDNIAVNLGCYKNILDCAERNEGFYAKCGYGKAGTEMSHYFEPYKSDYERG